MAYAALADLIQATWASWRAARAAGDSSAMQREADQLVWQARESVKFARDNASNLLARRVLEEVLSPAADQIGEVAEVLRRAGWR